MLLCRWLHWSRLLVAVTGFCPQDCSGRGKCSFGQCWCSPGYVGKACEIKIFCHSKCTDHGVCHRGVCFCMPGWTGPDCDVRLDSSVRLLDLQADLVAVKATPAYKQISHLTNTCPGGCGFNGVCVNSTCLCFDPYFGPGCSLSRSIVAVSHCGDNNTCNGRGDCLLNRCFCQSGFGGKLCQHREPTPCPGACSGTGTCFLGKCICDPGYTGNDCSSQSPCPGCSNGVCITENCLCLAGWTGSQCNVPADSNGFGFKGARFRQSDSDSTQSFSSVLALSECEKECGANGVCFNKMCFCKPGFTGHDCSKISAEQIEAVPVPQVSVTESAPNLETPTLDEVSSSMPVASSRFIAPAIGFAAGVAVVIISQLAWTKRNEQLRQRQTKNLLKPLLHSIDQ